MHEDDTVKLSLSSLPMYMCHDGGVFMSFTHKRDSIMFTVTVYLSNVATLYITMPAHEVGAYLDGLEDGLSWNVSRAYKPEPMGALRESELAELGLM